ncbi:DNA-binding transcriptional response regulator, NtrC family, contains REC, AAA-type ATPase, and a Fis-type DNA-binding domains [Marivirga sericea]|uniref:DNA-binding transcriptional response regulator, NtrC family, contains REC, AAA-type ATPase, and a Fis-type DNA-binding domains n=1 Tax=Marivirga sericea TaxID=1028 RepID=A0A1X7IAX5_9BACT|nr:sigma-54 dependent transcriptional regulator [Marivirga sericea]SMG11223.1 DNA-binding transcriptional response regulator, NtrC family, contains REC, AAA-type ATPase, and a Fis-type DNA-binding domains [Marivirga sericea]
MNYKIFIVEDDPWYGEMLKYHLEMNPEYEITLFDNGREVLSNLYRKPDLVCIDFGLPDMNGEVLLKRLKQENVNLPVIIISGQEDIEVAVSLLKIGARDYIIKNDHTKENLWQAVINARENTILKQEVEELKDQLEEKFDFSNSIIGQSQPILKVFKTLEKAIKSNINVSVTGETGTGKELVAKAIHFNSDRKRKPLIAVNMAAIPPELVESELFGHEKGAFTGATSQKTGKFLAANGGTLFLDEIAELDLSIQTKLLRALQEREVVPIGSNKSTIFDARLITATHKDLAKEVQEGRFREDLYYRIIGLPIELPPLRERGNDILLLANNFVQDYCKTNKAGKITFSEDAKQKLYNYEYPGNVRELKAIVDLACVLCDEDKIQPKEISFNKLAKDNFISFQEKSLKEYQTDIISYFLNKYNQNVVMVAEKLSIGKSTIYNLIKAGDIKLEE